MLPCAPPPSSYVTLTAWHMALHSTSLSQCLLVSISHPCSIRLRVCCVSTPDMGEVKQALRSLLASHAGYLESKRSIWLWWAKEETRDLEEMWPELSTAKFMNWQQINWTRLIESGAEPYIEAVSKVVQGDSSVGEVFVSIRKRLLEIGIVEFAEWDLQKDVNAVIFAQTFIKMLHGYHIRYASDTPEREDDHSPSYGRLPKKLLRSESVGDMVRRMRWMDDMTQQTDFLDEQLCPDDKRLIDAHRSEFLHTYGLEAVREECLAQQSMTCPGDVSRFGLSGHLVPEMEEPYCTLVVTVHAALNVPLRCDRAMVRMKVMGTSGQPLRNAWGGCKWLGTAPSQADGQTPGRFVWGTALHYRVPLQRTQVEVKTRHGAVPHSAHEGDVGAAAGRCPFVQATVPVAPPFDATAPALHLHMELVDGAGVTLGAVRTHVQFAGEAAPNPETRELLLDDAQGQVSDMELHIGIQYPFTPPTPFPDSLEAYLETLQHLRSSVPLNATGDDPLPWLAAVQHGINWYPTNPEVLYIAACLYARFGEDQEALRLMKQSLFYGHHRALQRAAAPDVALLDAAAPGAADQDAALQGCIDRLQVGQEVQEVVADCSVKAHIHPILSISESHSLAVSKLLVKRLANAKRPPSRALVPSRRGSAGAVSFQPPPEHARGGPPASGFKRSSKWYRRDASWPTDVLILEDDLRERFDVYDDDCNGYLDHQEFLHVYQQLENFGLEGTEKSALSMIGNFNMLGDNALSFEEYCIIMLRVAQR